MGYELLKNEFIELKKEELDYINNVVKISSDKILSECEKIEIYRKLKSYEEKLNEIFKRLSNAVIDDETLTRENLKDVIVEFEVDKNYLSSLKLSNPLYKKIILEDLRIDIETFKYKLTLKNLIYDENECRKIDYEIILNKQKLIENSIYMFCGYYDCSEDCYGPCIGDPDDYLEGIYEDIWSRYGDKINISKRDVNEFEKEKIIIYSTRYVRSSEIKKIFNEEVLNINNMTINDCAIQTKNRVNELNYIRSPEYKEKKLLDRINELYKEVKGDFIKKEILYSGNFLDVLCETYKIPNNKIVKKEKIVKNGGKNSVVVIALTRDNEYIITFQNRIKDKIIAEFPSGYIEDNEDVIEASKRELKEETGYITDDLFIVDEVYTSPGIDNSVTYIVIANNCIKTDEKSINGTELINYGLFSETELKYLINENIMNGAINKLAFYNLINNVENCNIVYGNKKLRKKINILDN